MTEGIPEIENPRLWRLAMQVSDLAMHVAVSSMVSDGTLVQFVIPLNASAPALKALEDAVYSAPQLLLDYGRVDIIYATDAYTLLPAGLDDDACRYAAFCSAIADENDEIFIDRADNAAVAWALDADIANFLARTFRNAPVHCHITPLLQYLGRRAAVGNAAKLYAHMAHTHIDIVCHAPGGTLALAATHPLAGDTDALYYIMACAEEAKLDLRSDEILLCGDSSRRHGISQLLSRYAAHVMPLIFPSAALRMGREAFKVPFPLIIMPLCE